MARRGSHARFKYAPPLLFATDQHAVYRPRKPPGPSPPHRPQRLLLRCALSADLQGSNARWRARRPRHRPWLGSQACFWYAPPPLLPRAPEAPLAYCALDKGIACAQHIQLPDANTGARKGDMVHKYPQNLRCVGSSGQTLTKNVPMTLCNWRICHQTHVLCGCTTFGTELN